MKRHMKYVHEREELRSVTFVKIVLFCSTDKHDMKRHMKYVLEREEPKSVTFVKIVLF